MKRKSTITALDEVALTSRRQATQPFLPRRSLDPSLCAAKVVFRKLKDMKMLSDFSADYSKPSDDELLLLASDRASLTTEAAIALDAELHRRNLTASDQLKYQQFVKGNEQREARRRRRKILGARRDRGSWVNLLGGLLAIVLISSVYRALPSRFHMKPDWQEAALLMMFTSVSIAAVFGTSVWRKMGFWVSLVLSSSIHVVVVHGWVQRAGSLSRGQGKLAILLGIVLFFAIYGLGWVLRRNFYGEEAHDQT
jgi:hypothetical protein